LCTQENDLEKLLQDESFLVWLKGEPTAFASRWENWLSESSRNSELAKIAKVLLTMPFTIVEPTELKSSELQQLRKRLKEMNGRREEEQQA